MEIKPVVIRGTALGISAPLALADWTDADITDVWSKYAMIKAGWPDTFPLSPHQFWDAVVNQFVYTTPENYKIIVRAKEMFSEDWKTKWEEFRHKNRAIIKKLNGN